jgi:hypothetical protein
VRLVTYTAGGEPRVGARTEAGKIVDLNRAYYARQRRDGPVSARQVETAVPSEMVAFLEAGPRALAAARDLLCFVEQAASGELAGPWGSRVLYDEAEVRLLAPVLQPRKIVGIGVRLWLNGELMQDSRTDRLIWDIPFLVSFLSAAFTLEPGDLVATGTPSGVGFARQPPVFMNPGDRVRMEVEGLGVLENVVVARS